MPREGTLVEACPVKMENRAMIFQEKMAKVKQAWGGRFSFRPEV